MKLSLGVDLFFYYYVTCDCMYIRILPIAIKHFQEKLLLFNVGVVVKIVKFHRFFLKLFNFSVFKKRSNLTSVVQTTSHKSCASSWTRTTWPRVRTTCLWRTCISWRVSTWSRGPPSGSTTTRPSRTRSTFSCRRPRRPS